MRPRGNIVLVLMSAAIALLAGLVVAGRGEQTKAIAQSGNCAAITSPVFIPVSGTLTDIHFDDACAHVYASNSSLNRIEVLSLSDLALESPIDVGSNPSGFDITPDDSTIYVANSGANNISVVDLATKTELRKISVPAGFSNDTPFSIAIANNGKALFSTTFAGSGFGGRMMELNLATDATSQRSDFWAWGDTTEATLLRASGDRSKIGIVEGDDSGGPVYVYSAAADSFTPEKYLNAFVHSIAADGTGSRFLVDGTYVLAANLNLIGTIAGGSGDGALKPMGDYGFRVGANGIDILDLVHFLKLGTMPVGDTTGNVRSRIAISHDGSLLAVTTDHGIAVLPALTAAPTPTATWTATATPTRTATLLPSATPRPTASPTPATGGKPANLFGIRGTVQFSSGFESGARIQFGRFLDSRDYTVVLTPIQRACQPIVTSKTVWGFSFSCAGSGGSVDWLVVTGAGGRGD